MLFSSEKQPSFPETVKRKKCEKQKGCRKEKDKSFDDPEERWAFGDAEDGPRESFDTTSREPVFGFGRSDNLGTGLSGPARDIERNLGMRH